MTDRAIRWWIAERVVVRAFYRMGQGQGIDQVVVVAGLTINLPDAGHAIGNSSLDFIGKGADIDTFDVFGRTGAVYRVGVATSAIVFVDGMDAAKVGGIKVTAAVGAVF